MELVRRRERFDRDPIAFRLEMEPEQARLRGRLRRARALVASVALEDDLLARISELCLKLNVDGHRGELTMMRAAKALAAFEGRRRATPDDARRVAVLALRHRLRRDSFGGVDAAVRIEQAMAKVLPSAGINSNGHGH